MNQILIFFSILTILYSEPTFASQHETIQLVAIEKDAEAAFHYFLNEVERDDTLTHQEQDDWRNKNFTNRRWHCRNTNGYPTNRGKSAKSSIQQHRLVDDPCKCSYCWSSLCTHPSNF